jgi:hypothetical protein
MFSFIQSDVGHAPFSQSSFIRSNKGIYIFFTKGVAQGAIHRADIPPGLVIPIVQALIEGVFTNAGLEASGLNAQAKHQTDQDKSGGFCEFFVFFSHDLLPVHT